MSDVQAKSTTAINEERKPVDIDSLEIKILMVVKSPSQFGAITQFLERRNWKVAVVSDVSEVIKRLSGQAPDFVFLSFNHPNPKVFKLPGIIERSFDTDCVGFCETPDLITESRLTSAKIKNKLVGAASGPSIFRRVKQILAEKYGVAENSEFSHVSKSNFSVEDNESVRVKGSSDKEKKSGLAYIPKQQESRVDRAELIKNLTRELDEKEDELLKEEIVKEGLNFQKGHNDKSSNIMSSHLSPNTTPILNQKGMGQGDLMDLRTQNPNDLSSAKNFKNESISSSVGLEKRPESSGLTKMEIQKSRPDLVNTINNSDTGSNLNLSSITDANPKTTPSHNPSSIIEKATYNGSNTNPMNGLENKLESTSHDTHIQLEPVLTQNKMGEKGDFLYIAILKSIRRLKTSDRQEDIDLKKIKKIRAISLSVGDISGYIVLASSVSVHLDEVVTHEFSVHLKNELEKNFSKKETKFNFSMSVDPMDLIDSLELNSEILIVESFGKGYFVAGFIPAKIETPKINFDSKMKMYIIPFELLQPGQNMRFNTSLYMEANEKLLIYSNKGGSLTQRQILNLVKNKKNLYVEESDLDLFSIYYHENNIKKILRKTAQSESA